MTEVTLRKSERTRQRILDAAAQVFAERGYAGTRMADIAERARMRAGSLYYHFASKDELVEALLRFGVEWTHDHVRRAVEQLGDDATPAERVRTAIASHLEAVLEVGDYAAAHARIAGQVPPPLRGKQLAVERAYGRWWHEVLEHAAAAGQIRCDLDLVTVRLLVIGALNWTVEWPPGARRPAAELAEAACRLVLEGLEQPRRSRDARRDGIVLPESGQRTGRPGDLAAGARPGGRG